MLKTMVGWVCCVSLSGYSLLAMEPEITGVRVIRGSWWGVDLEISVKNPSKGVLPDQITLDPGKKASKLKRLDESGPDGSALFRGSLKVRDFEKMTRALAKFPVGGKLKARVWENRGLAATNEIDPASLLAFLKGDQKKLEAMAFETSAMDRETTWRKSLFITDTSVVDSAEAGPGGAWHFGTVIRELARRSNLEPEEFLRRWLRHWEVTQSVNFDVVNPKPGAANFIKNWPRHADGPLKDKLDLDQAPFRLLAIVHRPDLRGDILVGGPGSAGENRLVYGLGSFTVIFEFGIKAYSFDDIAAKSRRWHDLQFLTDPVAYRAALKDLTNLFILHDNPDGNTLDQARTNELALGGDWQLREFKLSSASGGHLEQVTIKQTPQTILSTNVDNAGILNKWINDNARSILAEKAVFPLNLTYDLSGLAGAVFEAGPLWGTNGNPSVATAALRQSFSLQTCNGCHNAETRTGFFHVFPREAGAESALSQFMTGTDPDVLDPAGSGRKVHFSEKERRLDDLDAMLNLPWFFQLNANQNHMVH